MFANIPSTFSSPQLRTTLLLFLTRLPLRIVFVGIFYALTECGRCIGIGHGVVCGREGGQVGGWKDCCSLNFNCKIRGRAGRGEAGYGSVAGFHGGHFIFIAAFFTAA